MEFYLSEPARHRLPAGNRIIHFMLTDPQGPYRFSTDDMMNYRSGDYSIEFPRKNGYVLVRVPDSDAMNPDLGSSKAWVPAPGTRGSEIVHMLYVILCAEDVLAGNSNSLRESFGLKGNEEAA